MTEIGESAFSGCSGLTSIEILGSVTSIGGSAFEGCSGLTGIEIPNSVTSIGSWAFDGCSGLTSIEIPSSVTSIGDYAFSGCSGLTNIEIPSSDTSIGIYAFSYCTGLTSIDIPSSVTSISEGTFAGCSGLTSIEIPSSVTNIGENAFCDCENLAEIHWTPSPDSELGSQVYIWGLDGSQTLYLYKNTENASLVEELKTELASLFKEIIIIDMGVGHKTFNLAITGAGISTLYLDYSVEIPDDENLQGVFYVYQIEGNTMLMKKLDDYIPANNGVIVMAYPGTLSFQATEDEVEEIADNQLQGVTQQTSVASIDGTVYTLGHGKKSGNTGFYKYTGKNIPANKAFMVRDASSSVNAFSLVLDNEDGTTTFIGRIDAGELVTDSSAVYDLQGRRVEHPTKGLYIVNGKVKYIK